MFEPINLNVSLHPSSKMVPESSTLNYTVQEPLGVAVLISPWNLPLYLLTFKLAPALVCGNTVVAKPSELTSVTAHMLCQLFVEAGKEVVYVHGFHASSYEFIWGINS